MLLEVFITAVTSVTLAVVGYLVHRIESTKKELLKLRTSDLYHIDLKIAELKADIHDIYLYLLDTK